MDDIEILWDWDIAMASIQESRCAWIFWLGVKIFSDRKDSNTVVHINKIKVSVCNYKLQLFIKYTWKYTVFTQKSNFKFLSDLVCFEKLGTYVHYCRSSN